MSGTSVIGMRMNINVLQNMFRTIDAAGTCSSDNLKTARYLILHAMGDGSSFIKPPKLKHINQLFEYNDYPLDMVYGKVLELFGSGGDTNERRIAMAIFIGTLVRVDTLIKEVMRRESAEEAGLEYVIWKP